MTRALFSKVRSSSNLSVVQKLTAQSLFRLSTCVCARPFRVRTAVMEIDRSTELDQVLLSTTSVVTILNMI